MKIGNPAPGVHEQAPATPAGSGRGTTEEAAKAAPAGGADRSAKVELSPVAASLMSGVKGTAADFDAARVDSISRSIADGSYAVDAGAIADKLIANAQEVLANAQR